jgi:hypothetical protein
MSILVGLSLLFAGSAQIIHGKVIDKTTGQQLPYASVGFRQQGGGGITGRDGEFSIDLSNIHRADSLLVSYIGYASRTLALTDLEALAPLTVGLIRVPKELPETAVAGKRQLITIGNDKYNGDFTGWGDYSSSRGRMRGILILPKEYPVRAVQFGCHIKHNTFDSVKVRLHILVFHSDSAVTQELLHDNIYMVIPGNAKWVSVDLTPYHIVINDTIVLGMEWVDAWSPATKSGQRSHLLTFSLANTAGYVYARDYPYDKTRLIQNAETPAMYLLAYRTARSK